MAAADGRGGARGHLDGSGRLRVIVLYDGGAEDWTTEDVQSVLEPVRAVAAVLRRAKHKVRRTAVHAGLDWLDAVRSADVVFNLCEGIGGISHLEYKVASAIDLVGVPYTGAGAWSMTVCHQKPLLNAVLGAAGLPIPDWATITPNDQLDRFPLPALVKPAAEDASVGIDQGSVVTTRAALRARVKHLGASFSEIMVQRYIHGRELAVGIVGDRVLPISEIDFSDMPVDAWPILSFAAKWTPGSAEDAGSQPVCPADVEPALAERLVDLALRAWRAVRGEGYARVDFRVDQDGRPWILEVNPNPDISTDAGLARMARAGGWSYSDLVLQILSEVTSRQASTPASAPAIGRVQA